MTRPSPRRTTSALAALGLAAVLSAACGGSSSGQDTDREPTARELFSANCARCHGRAGEGSFLGPTLQNLDAHWEQERLVRYIRDPEPVIAEDVRLRKQGRNYTQRMPAFPHLSPDQRRAIADWLLSGRP